MLWMLLLGGFDDKCLLVVLKVTNYKLLIEMCHNCKFQYLAAFLNIFVYTIAYVKFTKNV